MKRRHCLIDRRLQTAEALFIRLQPADLNTLYLSPQLSVRPVEVTVMTRSRGSWEGEGSWGRRDSSVRRDSWGRRDSWRRKGSWRRRDTEVRNRSKVIVSGWWWWWWMV